MSDSYVPVKYPAYRFHKSEPPRQVQNADEEKALGPGWFDSPAKVSGTAKEEKAPEKQPEKPLEKQLEPAAAIQPKQPEKLADLLPPMSDTSIPVKDQAPVKPAAPTPETKHSHKVK